MAWHGPSDFAISFRVSLHAVQEIYSHPSAIVMRWSANEALEEVAEAVEFGVGQRVGLGCVRGDRNSVLFARYFPVAGVRYRSRDSSRASEDRRGL